MLSALKNSDHKKFARQAGLTVIMIVFFMFPLSATASHRGHGANSKKDNISSDISDRGLHGANGLKKTFDRMDINSDGRLTAADYDPDMSKLVLLTMIPRYRKIIPALILESRKKWYTYARLDTNGDGQVDFKEFSVPR